MAYINHIGLYVKDIEASKHFFEKYFGAKAGNKYHNHHKSFSSYLLSFNDGATLEIMTRPDLNLLPQRTNNYGYAHISLSVGSQEKVNEITKYLIDDGYIHLDGPRTTGDGYYESAIVDAEGNVIEITV